MKKLQYLSICLTLFIVIAASFRSDSVSAGNSFAFRDETSPGGVKETVLAVPAGKVKVYLPEDIRPGDTISGYISAQPEGKTEAERSRNQATLENLVLEIAGARQGAWQKGAKNSISTTIKFSLTSGTTPTGALRSNTGTVVSSFNVPVSALGITAPPTSAATPESFTLPTIGQQGRPVQIQGPFDGSFDNTAVNVGGQPALALAESPRAVVFRSPEDVVGPTEIAMKEGSVEKTAPYRSVGVNLKAPKINLSRGESTTLTVEVIGLRDLTTPVPVQLIATGPINMSGGNTQILAIAPEKVNPAGIYTQTFSLTASQAGAFGVAANVLPGGAVKKCECKCELDDSPIAGAGRDKIKGGGTTYTYKANVKTAECKGEKCSVGKVTYVWTIIADGTTATYAVQNGTVNAEKFKVDVTGAGTLKVSVTVTVTCSDDSKCSSTGTATFDVKK